MKYVPGVLTLLCCIASCLDGAKAQTSATAGEARVKALLHQMTLDEKLAMIHGTGEPVATYQGEAGYLPGVPRLGIPPMRFVDGPPGVLTRIPATAPTSTMGLAATFSREDARRNGEIIAREAQARGAEVVLQPFINIDRDFRFGRAYNTFGEDPFLSGQMGAAEIVGIQSLGVMAQAKHFVGYDTDNTDVTIGEQALHEVYVAPFAEAVRAGVSSIMCSYNQINGPYACGNPATLKTVLRDQLGFGGFVTSDWGAVHATAFINAGTDLEMPGTLPVSWNSPSYFVNNAVIPPGPEYGPALGPPLTDAGLPEEPARVSAHTESHPPERATTDLKALLATGGVSEARIDEAAGRVLLQMVRFGLLDGKNRLSVRPDDPAAYAGVLEKTAEDAAVLLKNDGAILPLRPEELGDVVFIGPTARQSVAAGLAGEKAVGRPEREIGPLQAIAELAPAGHTPRFAVADDMEGTPVPAAALSHAGRPGLEQQVAGRVVSAAEVNFTQANGRSLPADTTAAWIGTLTIQAGGRYRLHLQVLGCYGTLQIDDQLVAKNGLMWIHGDVTQAGQDNILPTLDGLDNLRAEVPLSAGPHRIRVTVEPDSSHAPTQVRFSWVTPAAQKANHAAAVDAARHAKTVVVFAWSRTRPAFGLPGDQDRLIREVIAANPRTIVVLNVSQPVALPWLAQVPAVMNMWWPGDEGGRAAARLLLGKADPGGHLPFTWPRRLEDMAAADPAHPERSGSGVDGKANFSEGVLVGYRWLDEKGTAPEFPFGFGLSYTAFELSAAEAHHDASGGVEVAVQVKNAGKVAGDEVAQVYVERPASPPAEAQFAPDILAGFERVHLEPGATATVRIHVPLRQLQYWSVSRAAWVTPPGPRQLFVGGSSRDRAQRLTIDAGAPAQ